METGENKGEETLRDKTYHNSLEKLMNHYVKRRIWSSEGLDTLKKIVNKQQEIYDYIEDKLGNLW